MWVEGVGISRPLSIKLRRIPVRDSLRGRASTRCWFAFPSSEQLCTDIQRGQQAHPVPADCGRGCETPQERRPPPPRSALPPGDGGRRRTCRRASNALAAATGSQQLHPAYLSTIESGMPSKRADLLEARSSTCELCSHRYGARRADGERGRCRLSTETLVVMVPLHFRKEAALTGHGGSVVMFFASCSTACLFCPGFEIRHLARGDPSSAEQLVGVMPCLQRLVCHSINPITPTRVVRVGVIAQAIAAARGLHTFRLCTASAATNRERCLA